MPNLTFKYCEKFELPALPIFEGLGSTAVGLIDPPDDKLDGDPVGWCQGVFPAPIRVCEGIVTFFTEKKNVFPSIK